jgi:predicted RNA-binding protein with PUA-like domain
MNFWLVKSEPAKYAWTTFLKDKRTFWDGVRNYQARNNLQAMKLGDEVLFYHSNEGMCVVGIARVVKEHYPDPTIDDARWVVVDLEPIHTLKKPVSLEQIKADELLSNVALIRQSRLSVMPLKEAEFSRIVQMSDET